MTQTALLSSKSLILGPAQLGSEAKYLFTVCVWGWLDKIKE